jgi:hypothetical protein
VAHHPAGCVPCCGEFVLADGEGAFQLDDTALCSVPLADELLLGGLELGELLAHVIFIGAVEPGAELAFESVVQQPVFVAETSDLLSSEHEIGAQAGCARLCVRRGIGETDCRLLLAGVVEVLAKLR